MITGETNSIIERSHFNYKQMTKRFVLEWVQYSKAWPSFLQMWPLANATTGNGHRLSINDAVSLVWL